MIAKYLTCFMLKNIFRKDTYHPHNIMWLYKDTKLENNIPIWGWEMYFN